MKKIFLVYLILCNLIGFLFSTTTQQSIFFAINEPEYVRVILETSIYSEANIKSNILKSNLEVNTILKVDTDFSDTMFYKISLYEIIDSATQSDFGYILKTHTLDSSIESPNKKLDYNAEVKNDGSMLYEYDYISNTYVETQNYLNKGTKIKILDGYDKNKEYTYISYENNGDIISLYIKTSNLSVKGINYSVIVAISTLFTCVIILFIVFGIKGKTKKKQKN